mmetsp:Transcript_73747/g.137823  ORF Transcript_73747/g.137823 Transcript_73747/m.137823 type:complete len:113 (+) Transcript_73747:104-442(+)
MLKWKWTRCLTSFLAARLSFGSISRSKNGSIFAVHFLAAQVLLAKTKKVTPRWGQDLAFGSSTESLMKTSLAGACTTCYVEMLEVLDFLVAVRLSFLGALVRAQDIWLSGST